MDNWHIRIRFLVFRVVILAAFAVVGLRLWELQIVSAGDYRRRADDNRFRVLPIEAPRGIMYDRNGRLLVRNVPSFSVSIIPAGLPEDEAERRAVLTRLGELLSMPVDAEQAAQMVSTGTDGEPEEPKSSIEEILVARFVNSYSAVRIANNVDRDTAFVIDEERLDLPGVLVEARPIREYLEGPLLAHLIGYLGRIPSEQADTYLKDNDYPYQPDDLVGLAGLEYTQEEILRGDKGQRHIEVDAFGQEVRTLAEQPASDGHNLILTIDTELQRMVQDALARGMERAHSDVGVAIVIDPRNGEVLSSVSLPTYDSNLFSGGISFEDYERLSTDKSRPLVNHAVTGQYPPGSTFKIITAAAALQEQVISSATTVLCRGIMYLPNKFYPDNRALAQPFYCWARYGHGTVSVVSALEQSCNIFFHQVAGGFESQPGVGIERFGKYMEMFGFGTPTGIELPAESAGLVPTDKWKRQNYNQGWLTGDTYNAAIGQGYVLASPLQLLNSHAAMANGGTLYRPQLVRHITDADGNVINTAEPDPIRTLDLSPETISLIREGMRRAVNGQHATARAAQLPDIVVGGKTGTAEYLTLDDNGNVVYDAYGNLPTHAWFTAFAPFDNPEIAIVIFLEGGGEGSRTAVPIAAEILRYYFDVDGVRTGATPTETAVAE